MHRCVWLGEGGLWLKVLFIYLFIYSIYHLLLRNSVSLWNKSQIIPLCLNVLFSYCVLIIFTANINHVSLNLGVERGFHQPKMRSHAVLQDPDCVLLEVHDVSNWRMLIGWHVGQNRKRSDSGFPREQESHETKSKDKKMLTGQKEFWKAVKMFQYQHTVYFVCL